MEMISAFFIFGLWSGTFAQGIPEYILNPSTPLPEAETDMLSHLLESQICEIIPDLPSCQTLNDTLQSDPDMSSLGGLPQDKRFMTLVMDYIATTQKLNRDLSGRDLAQVAEIAKLEQIKEQLENQVRALENEWLPTVDKYPGARFSRSVDKGLPFYTSSSNQLSSDTTVYRPTASIQRPADCTDYLVLGEQQSGVYDIYPFKCRCSEPIKVWCDMETDGGGWTVILNRQNSSDLVNFSQPWVEYQKGFGNASNEYWIGLENLYLMTNTRPYTLRANFEQKDGARPWTEWPKFSVGPSSDKYRVEVSPFNSLSITMDAMAQSNKKYFSAFDHDNDGHASNCAETRKGGWWFPNNCGTFHPTHIFDSAGHLNVGNIYIEKGRHVALLVTAMQMKVRPEICNRLVKAVQFNSHTCNGHNGF